MPVDVAPLVADGGQIRLVRRVAAYVFGGRDVTLPEDVDNPVDFLPDRREFGWVAQLAGPRPGLSGRRFVRADATIDAVEGVSNTEQLLDDAAERAGGDVHFETVIRGRGLAGQEPGVDFRLGDRLAARFWQRLLPGQLVTEVGWDEQGPYAKFGGQMIRDLDALDRTRTELIRTIKKEREEAAGDVQAVRAYADRRATTAEDNAKRYADERDGVLVTSMEDHTREKIEEALETAADDLKDYREDVEKRIGEQGTITVQLADLADEVAAKVGDNGTLVTEQKNISLELETLTNDFTAKVGDNGTLVQSVNDLTTEYEKLSQDFTEKVGENGTLTKGQEGLVRKYEKLSQDFTDKVGENGTLVQGQSEQAALLGAMINNTAHPELTNTEFRKQQQSVNAMQNEFNKKQVSVNTGFQNLFNAQSQINQVNDAFKKRQVGINKGFQDLFTAQDQVNAIQNEFNKRQVGINTGFQNLFNAQDQINAVNKAFKDKQLGINEGFQKLFEAQQFTNDMQRAFNEEQKGINVVYNKMWEMQEKTDLMQNFLIEYNRLTAEGNSPKPFMFHLDIPAYGYKSLTGDDFQDYSGLIADNRMWFTSKYELVMVESTKPEHPSVLLGSIYIVNQESIKSIPVTSLNNNEFAMGRDVYRGFRIDVPYDWHGKRVRFAGMIVPSTTLPWWEHLINELKKEYRGKGLAID